MAPPLLKPSGSQIWIGIDDDDLPAAHSFHGNSGILVAPTWRLRQEGWPVSAVHVWVRERVARECGVTCGEASELGGRYHPSPGVTPEVVFPIALPAEGEAEGERTVAWEPLADAMAHLADLHDGHLRIVALRAAHATGTLER